MVSYPVALAPRAEAAVVAGPAPIEYTAAVDRYLAQAPLSAASRRVYRISLVGWAWPLVGKPVPGGAARRSATPPLVPLALLDDPAAGGRLAAALAERAARADPRTVNRELSALLAPSLGAAHVDALFALPASLREQAFWRVLYDSGASAAEVLALNPYQLDLSEHRVRARPDDSPAADIVWQPATSQILRWLLSGRTWGPVFLTDRRAPAGTGPADVCPLTGQARMSYRRAAEIFAALTRPLDPAGRGWTLHQLSGAEHAGR